MTIVELKAAINFGKETIEEYKKNEEQVPAFVYEKMMKLYEQLAEALSIEE